MIEDREESFKDKLIIGIDLGTTKSVVSVWDKALDKVVILADEEGRDVMPSLVAWDRDRRGWIVGHEAKPVQEQRPGDVVYSIKRYIGRWFSDPEVMKSHHKMPYKLISGGGADQLNDILVSFGSAANSPPPQSAPEICSQILVKLRGTAARALNLPLEDVRYAVITVPAYFNVLQRRATILAGQKAGLTVVDILNEPTAAALSYKDVLEEKEKRMLVYDMGGGTFDISLLEARRDAGGYEFFTRVVDGDTRLGGDDIDDRLVDWLRNQIRDRYHQSVRPDDVNTIARLRLAAERSKVQLGQTESVIVRLPALELGSSSPFDAEIEITRDVLNECGEDVIRRAREISERAIREIAGLEWNEIDDVLLVGGQTLMAALQEDVKTLTGSNIQVSDRPQHAIALGAGEYARNLSRGGGRFHENSLTNVIALPLGVREKENDFVKLVDANSTVPYTSKPHYATNPEDNQTSIRVEVLQGTRGATKADHCVPLGFVEMDVLPKPARTHKFEIVLDVKSDGTMTVIVTDKHTNRSQMKDIVEIASAQYAERPKEGEQGNG
jgi:molecular chaperone DnaK